MKNILKFAVFLTFLSGHLIVNADILKEFNEKIVPNAVAIATQVKDLPTALSDIKKFGDKLNSKIECLKDLKKPGCETFLCTNKNMCLGSSLSDVVGLLRIVADKLLGAVSTTTDQAGKAITQLKPGILLAVLSAISALANSVGVASDTIKNNPTYQKIINFLNTKLEDTKDAAGVVVSKGIRTKLSELRSLQIEQLLNFLNGLVFVLAPDVLLEDAKKNKIEVPPVTIPAEEEFVVAEL